MFVDFLLLNDGMYVLWSCETVSVLFTLSLYSLSAPKTWFRFFPEVLIYVKQAVLGFDLHMVLFMCTIWTGIILIPVTKSELVLIITEDLDLWNTKSVFRMNIITEEKWILLTGCVFSVIQSEVNIPCFYFFCNKIQALISWGLCNCYWKKKTWCALRRIRANIEYWSYTRHCSLHILSLKFSQFYEGNTIIIPVL